MHVCCLNFNKVSVGLSVLFASRQCSVDSSMTVSWVTYREDRNHKGQEQLHQMSTSYSTGLKLLVSNTHTCTSIRYESVYQNISWSMKKTNCCENSSDEPGAALLSTVRRQTTLYDGVLIRDSEWRIQGIRVSETTPAFYN